MEYQNHIKPKGAPFSVSHEWEQINQKLETLGNMADGYAYKFLRMLENSALEHHSVSYFANQLNIHKDYLRQTCIESFGHPPSYFINLKLAHEACKLLSEPSLYIFEVADKLHFEDPSYFSRVFKKHVGVSPKIYRKLAQASVSNLNTSC